MELLSNLKINLLTLQKLDETIYDFINYYNKEKIQSNLK
ncbi:IS3 family transposase [[Mycoplasma] gypis]